MNAKTKLETAEQRPVRKLLSINGSYTIAAETSIEDMLNDIGCLLQASMSTIQAIIDGLSDEGGSMAANASCDVPRMLFGVLYQLEMVGNLAQASFPKA
jgi:hypothetical protein